MKDIKLDISENKDEYERCNLCLSDKELFNVRGNGRSNVIVICKECITKINNVVNNK